MRGASWVTLAACLLVSPVAGATPGHEAGDHHGRATEQKKEREHRGRPEVVFDRIEFPKSVRGWHIYKKHLKRELKRAARRADWGAGRGSRIEVRFTVEQLELVERDGALTVKCRAIGRLPRGKIAKGSLSFSGDPRKRGDLIRRVLGIVGAGVITRLAELERERRESIPDVSKPR